MSERLAKKLLCIEALIFLMPVSVITLLYAVLLIPMYQDAGLAKQPWQAHAAPVFTFLGLGLQLCGWRLIAAFVIDGRAGIRRVSSFYIHAVSLAAALVVISGLVALLLLLELELPDSAAVLLVNCTAIPALIPFLHVMVERWMSRRADVSRAEVRSADVGSADPGTA
jgi:hypothetical protein